MAKFYVSAQNGNDGNAGTSPDMPKATIQAGLNLFSAAGDICHVGPGTYREFITSTQNGSAGNQMKVIGDPECLALTADSPGICRITACDSNDFSVTGNGSRDEFINTNSHRWWYFENFIVDGLSNNPSQTPGQTSYLFFGSFTVGILDDATQFKNCVLQGSHYAMRRGYAINSLVIGDYIGGYLSSGLNSVFIGSEAGLWGANIASGYSASGCLAFGASYGFYEVETHNCLAFGNTYSFRECIAANCVSMNSRYGPYRCTPAYNSALSAHYIHHCTNYGRDSDATVNPIWWDYMDDDSYEASVYTGTTQVPVTIWGFDMLDNLRKAFTPLKSTAINYDSVYSLSGVDSGNRTDPLGHDYYQIDNEAKTWWSSLSYVEESWDSNHYNTQGPGFFFNNKGSKRIDLIAATGDVSVSANVYLWGSPAGYGAQIRIDDEFGSVTQNSSSNDTTGSWNVISASASITGGSKLCRVFLETSDAACSAAFSDIGVY